MTDESEDWASPADVPDEELDWDAILGDDADDGNTTDDADRGGEHPADYHGGTDDGSQVLDDVDGVGDVLDADDSGGDREPAASVFDSAESFDVDDVEQFLADRPSGDARRPALQKLTTDQQDVIRSFVDGFASRSAFLEWCQDAAIATLGELDGDWMQSRAFTRLDLSVLVTSEAREHYAPDTGVLSRRQAAGVRRGVVLNDLLPACTAAYKRLRWNATEYVNDADDSFVPDPDEQDHPAMRPALSELDDRQDWAVRKLLVGLPGEDSLLSWLQVVTEASYAEVPDDLGRRLTGERRARRMLLDDVDDDRRAVARLFRESFAAKFVLPGFAAAASQVGRRAGELAEQKATEITETTL